MKKVIIDIETLPIPHHLDKIHCIVTKELGGVVNVWLEENFKEFKEYATTVDQWIAHNGVGFDIPVLNVYFNLSLPTSWPGLVDTFIVSRLVNYSKYKTHGLAELGLAFGVPKASFSDFSAPTQEMIDYCTQDVKVTERVYKKYQKYIESKTWYDAMSIEHDITLVCKGMTELGFKFDVDKAENLLASVQRSMSTIGPVFQKEFPPWRVEDRRLKYRVSKDGTLNKKLSEAMSYGDWELDGDEVVFYKQKEFNPGSTKDRVEKLWECGWKPHVKSKTHLQFSRAKVGDMWGKSQLTPELYAQKKKYFNFYGWQVNEENLTTLPESAPEGASMLARWLTLEGRRSALETWLGCVSDDGRIHGKFWFIGAWTHRMSHSDPNQANIASPFKGEARNAVEEVKKEYDAGLRSCWTTDSILVGTDADGIQLRILAHYLRNPEYVEAIVNGRKEDETDIHNLNKRALGMTHVDRDDAKTFIYAWLLGAGVPKVASILKTQVGAAGAAVNRFVESTKGLSQLKRGKIVRDARQGWFEGLDGRKVACNSEHLMLAGYLQNGEAIIMKRANRLWRKWADEDLIEYGQVNFVHDEWQTECYGSQDMAEHLGLLQRTAIEQVGKDLNLYCPLAGSTDYGRNWLETH